MRPMIEYVNEMQDQDWHLMIGAEVGVWEGKNALEIVKNVDMRVLYLVDSWKAHKIESNRYFSQDRMDVIMATAIARLISFDEVICIVRKNSVEATRHIEGDLDFVYIDASHDYKSIKRDINAWWHKVRKGGVVGGHDYVSEPKNGVARAVDNLVLKYNLRLFQKDLDWWVIKK